MSLFNKVNKGIDKQKLAEANQRITDLYNKIGALLNDEKVSFYEMMDLLNLLQRELNMRIANTLRANHQTIKEQEDKLTRYDLNKSEESAGEKDKQ
jgi:hypothetical protein